MSTRAVGAAIAAAVVFAQAAGAQTRTDTVPRVADGPRVVVRDAGPGVAGRILREILARPHSVIVSPDTGIVLPRSTDVAGTLVVIGGPARLEGKVRGDFVVLGDLVLRPGAVVEGRAIAFGGDLLNSSLAVVGRGRSSYPFVGFRVTPTGTGELALAYEAREADPLRTFSLPGVFGVRIPTYDRVNGLSLTFGPEIALADGRLRLEPAVTYRSQLGVVDGSADVLWEPTRRTLVEARAARGTFTNDAWIRGDLTNSAVTLAFGGDARNYYRADRGEATIARRFETPSSLVTPFVGALVERSWSAARDSLAPSAPYSVFGRDDAEEGIRRSNPGVTGGSIASALLGVRASRLTGTVLGSGAIRLELPVRVTGGGHFVQATVDARVAFPTVREQTFEAVGHAVVTGADRAPSQRYAYLGGGGTIPTMRLLEQGGDQLAWLESRYTIPLPAIRLPLVGSPRVMLRHIVGGAGVDRLPPLTQNVGVRLMVAGLRFDYVLDPAHPERHEFGVGFGMR